MRALTPGKRHRVKFVTRVAVPKIVESKGELVPSHQTRKRLPHLHH